MAWLTISGCFIFPWPITTDYTAAKLALSSATPDFIPSPGTALDQALDYSLNYFDPESPASKVLVIMSDGEDHEENWNEQRVLRGSGKFFQNQQRPLWEISFNLKYL